MNKYFCYIKFQLEIEFNNNMKIILINESLIGQRRNLL